ncbi:hypothetical protein ILUMI_19005 [Ignelater luminosus]|uniref:DDE-1 domain-containing protein n=1 Tax=Ignelater luminosus TaxID=2038154 RepID=A0A8K0CGZ0_IGNLU|nr:hypothetical protein ILUMI_19005 [Ignelater luminosus]
MDNHESHISIEGINLCKDNRVTVLTVPLHCTHRLQPLDVGFLKPFHTFYNDVLSSWEKANLDTPVTIYQIAWFVGIAYPRSMTPVNTAAAFKNIGILPYDRHVLNEDFFGKPKHTESNGVDIESEDEVCDTYSLHESDTPVGIVDSDEELCALTLDPTKGSQIKSNDFLLVRPKYDATSNNKIEKYFIGQVMVKSNGKTLEMSFYGKVPKTILVLFSHV